MRKGRVGEIPTQNKSYVFVMEVQSAGADINLHVFFIMEQP